VVIDNKFAVSSYSAEDSKQLRAYALLAGDKFGIDFQDKGVAYIAYNQPNVSPKTLNLKHFTPIAGDEMLKFESNLFHAINASEYFPEFEPSEAGCRWCPAKAHCEHYNKDRVESLAQSFDEVLPAKSEGSPQGVTLPAPADVTPDKVHAFILFKRAFDDWYKDFFSHHQAQAIASPDKYEECKIVKGREGNRKWAVADQSVFEYLIGIMGYEPDAVTESPKLKSVAKIEKLLGKDSIETLGYMGFVIREEGKPQLALKDDKRKDYNIANLFTSVKDATNGSN